MKLIDKAYVVALIIIAVIAAVCAMIASNMGYLNFSLGCSIGACLMALVVVIYGLVQWKK